MQGWADGQDRVISDLAVTFSVWAAVPSLTSNLTALLFNWFTNTSATLLWQTQQLATDFMRQGDMVLYILSSCNLNLAFVFVIHIAAWIKLFLLVMNWRQGEIKWKNYSFKFFPVFRWTHPQKSQLFFLKDIGDFLCHYSAPLAELGAEHT